MAGAGFVTEVEWLVDPDAGSTPTVSGESLAFGSSRGRTWAARRPWRVLDLRAKIVVTVVALVAAASAVWFADRTPPLHATIAGAAVDRPASVLASADRQLRTYTQSRLGALDSRSRCYFNRVGTPHADDVAATLFCGPVLFYDGIAAAAYLQFPLRVTVSDHRAHVTPAATPADPFPGPVPGSAVLVRTDHAQPPPDAGGLRAPVPPPGPARLLVALSGADVPGVPTAPDRAIMGGLGMTLAVEAVGPITHYGRGLAERSAAPGERLIAFEIVLSAGEGVGVEIPRLSVGVQIDGATPRALPDAPAFAASGQWFVLSVPDATHTADLVFTDAGITQRVSLLTAQPAPGNVAVLQRTDRIDDAINAFDATAIIDDHGRRRSADVVIEKDPAYLGFFGPRGQHPAADRAYVRVHICYRFTGQDSCGSLLTPQLALTPVGGAPIRGRDVGSPAEPYDVFEVPASFTVGDLSVSGTVPIAPGVTMTLRTPVAVPIMFVPH